VEQPIAASFTFNMPHTEHNEPLHGDVHQLLTASPRKASLQAGTSDLAQVTFKTIRNNNLMRAQQLLGEKLTDGKYELIK
jgi:hypothetical protein